MSVIHHNPFTEEEIACLCDQYDEIYGEEKRALDTIILLRMEAQGKESLKRHLANERQTVTELLAHLEFAVKLLSGLPFGATAQVEAMHAAIAKAKGETP